MARVRDYRREYQRRQENLLERGRKLFLEGKIESERALTKREAAGHWEGTILKRWLANPIDLEQYSQRQVERQRLPYGTVITRIPQLSQADIVDLRKAKLSDADIKYIIDKRGGGVEGRLALKGMLKNVKKKGHFPRPDEQPYAPNTVGQLLMDSPRLKGK